MSDAQVVEPTVEPTAEPPVEPAAEPAVEPEPTAGKKTIANGKDEPTVEPAAEPQPEWPDDWRQKMADHFGAGDKKAVKKELKRLERMTDPTAVYGVYRDMESKLHDGGLVKIPGKDAKDEDVAEFNKAMGVPEKSEDYFKDIQLDNGAVIGEADKPVADAFAEAVHKVGATPSVVNAAMNWYFNNMEEQAAALDESDNTFRVESNQELKDEYGSAFNRYTGSISSLFSTAPGGMDVDAEGSLVGRLLGGRMADGKIIGNDPDMVRFLVGMSRELNPVAAVTEGGDQSGMSVDAEIKAIEADMKGEGRKAYFKDEEKQQRYRELVEARDKHRARA